MNTYADKAQDSKTQTSSSSVYQNKSAENTTLQLVDSRTEALSQKELQESISNSPRAMQLKSFQNMADSYTAQKEKPIQMVVNPDATDYKLDMFSVMLSHESPRTDGYNFKLTYKALFRDDHHHNPELLEFAQEVGSRHTYTEPGHAHPTVVDNWGWHDDGYSRSNQPQFYNDGIFNGTDFPGSEGLDNNIKDIRFEFRSRQIIRAVGTGKVVSVCEFPTVIMAGTNLSNMQTNPADGTKAEYIFKAPENDGVIPEEAFSAEVDF